MKTICKILIPFMFISCVTTRYVEVPVEKTVRDVQYLTDSVIINRDREVKVYTKGDTIIREVEVSNEVYHNREVHDTVTDSIVVVKPIEVEKPVYVNRPQWWTIWISVGIIIIFLVVRYRRNIQTLLNKMHNAIKHFIS